MLGFLSVPVFSTSLITLHLKNADIDWTRDYVRDMPNEPLGRLFVVGGFMHGPGNLALTAFAIAIELNIAAGQMKRTGVAVFLAWEFWASVQLIRAGASRGP